MAVRVDFYVLPDAGGRLLLACRLAEKAYNLGHQVLLYHQTRTLAEQIDDLLWTFKQHSFVPHNLVPHNIVPHNEPDDRTTPGAPVKLAWRQDDGADGALPEPPHQVLINLADTTPAFYDRFARVVEVVDQNSGALALSRARFKAYRDAGLTPTSHTL